MGVPITNIVQVNNTIYLSDGLSRVIQAHTLKFGDQFQVDQVNNHPNATFNGTFNIDGTETGSPYADFLIGTPSNFTQSSGAPFYLRNPLKVSGSPAIMSTTWSAIAATRWLISPSRSRYRRPISNAGTTPLPTSLETRTTEQGEVFNAAHSASILAAMPSGSPLWTSSNFPAKSVRQSMTSRSQLRAEPIAAARLSGSSIVVQCCGRSARCLSILRCISSSSRRSAVARNVTRCTRAASWSA